MRRSSHTSGHWTRRDLGALSGHWGDRIGAGDAFASGMIHARLRGLDDDMAALYGVAVAATFVQCQSERGEDWPDLSLADVEARVVDDRRMLSERR